MLTAMEIVGNPLDLALALTPTDHGWALIITRGPGHNYKVVTDGALPKDAFPDQQSALDFILEVLYSAMAANRFDTGMMAPICGIQDRATRQKAWRSLLDAGCDQADGCLTLAQVDRIINDLRETGQCDTSEWSAEPVEATGQ